MSNTCWLGVSFLESVLVTVAGVLARRFVVVAAVKLFDGA